MPELDVAALLSAYDLQLRGEAPDPLPAGVGVEQDGPLVRVLYQGAAGSSSIATSVDSTGLTSTR